MSDTTTVYTDIDSSPTKVEEQAAEPPSLASGDQECSVVLEPSPRVHSTLSGDLLTLECPSETVGDVLSVQIIATGTLREARLVHHQLACPGYLTVRVPDLVASLDEDAFNVWVDIEGLGGHAAMDLLHVVSGRPLGLAGDSRMTLEALPSDLADSLRVLAGQYGIDVDPSAEFGPRLLAQLEGAP